MTGHFTVYVGAQPYLDGPHDGGPILLIDADTDRLREVSQRYSAAASRQSLTLQEAVLASTDLEALVWYCFNDSRLNGTLAVESWRHVYPNLTIIDRLELQGRALHALLETWQDELGDLPQFGKIVLSQGDYLKVLSGLNAWESRITEVSVAGPSSAQQIWTSRLTSWFTERGFHSQNGGIHWQKDPLAVALRENQQLRTQLKCAQEMIDTILVGLTTEY